MNKIHIKSQDYAAGILPICVTTGRILLTKRGPKITQPNTWANFGGGYAIGETPHETAIREFYEESGCIFPVKLIPSYIDEKKDFKYYNFIGLIENEFIPKINKLTVDFDIEITDYKWLTFDQFMNFKGGTLHFGINQLIKFAGNQIKNIIEKKCNVKQKVNELLTPTSTKLNKLAPDNDRTVSSNVFIGNNIVKKLSKKGKYSKEELTVFKIMEKNPQIFAKTKIINNNLVIQEKLNVLKAKLDYIQLNIDVRNMLDDDFRYFMEIIPIYGLDNSVKEFIRKVKNHFSENDFTKFKNFVRLAVKVYFLYQNNKQKFNNNNPDLHASNFGYDENGKLKIHDFISN